jgi:5-hydroxyisourate hydrolase-like protein (transthyretin family)
MTGAPAEARVLSLLRMAEDGPVSVATFRTGPDGDVRLVVLTSSAAADSLGEGIYSARLDRVATLADGHAFLDALRDHLAGSPYWRLTDE